MGHGEESTGGHGFDRRALSRLGREGHTLISRRRLNLSVDNARQAFFGAADDSVSWIRFFHIGSLQTIFVFSFHNFSGGLDSLQNIFPSLFLLEITFSPLVE